MDISFVGGYDWKRWLSWLLPQPAQEVRTSWRSRNGAVITLRVARRRDAPLMQALVRDLSTQSRYHRFFFPLHELPPELLARFVCVDVTRNVSLLATIRRDSEEIAIAMGQYAVGDEMHRAEFGIVVADAWRREGLGTRMLDALASVAHAAGIERLDGDVLADNAAMRNLLEKEGFSVRAHPDDGHLVRAGKRLAASPRACPRLIAVVRQARQHAAASI
jgi:RimJ/RimL family protein N-acetyltransferase